MSELRLGRKQYWHPMSLQALPWDRFVRVVTDIMQQKLTLFPLLPGDLPLDTTDSPGAGTMRKWPWKVPKPRLVVTGKARRLEL